MKVWLTRAGKHGEREQFALDNSRAVIGWPLLSDLGDVVDREASSNGFEPSIRTPARSS